MNHQNEQIFGGGLVHDIDEFNNFDAPLEGVPMPRWQRKALEQSNSSSSVASTPHKTPKKPRTPQADRFIPNRSTMDLDVCRMQLTFDQGKENFTNETASGSMDTTEEYNSILASSLLDRNTRDTASSKILSFKTKAPAPKEGYTNSTKVLYSQNAAQNVRKNCKKSTRNIPQAPMRVLDAPEMLDDYYLNLLDWNRSNILAVALGQTVYLWNASSGTIEQLCETSAPDDYISSVSWIQDGNYLAVGTNSCKVQIWDSERLTQVRDMSSHSARIGSLAWNGPLLSSGSRDSSIHNHDVRIAQHHISTFQGHQQEVCGLKWSPNGMQLASGGNDNILNIWDAGQTQAKFTLTHHTAAVKALDWCPWQNNLLATGGGTADRMLRFWNTSTGACVNSIDTNSQVCSIKWSHTDKELVTSHGFSQNQLTVWKYPSLTRTAELTGHTSRVLHMALSPDGETVVSGAADETLRFWKVFSPHEDLSKSKAADVLASNRSKLRGVNIRFRAPPRSKCVLSVSHARSESYSSRTNFD